MSEKQRAYGGVRDAEIVVLRIDAAEAHYVALAIEATLDAVLANNLPNQSLIGDRFAAFPRLAQTARRLLAGIA